MASPQDQQALISGGPQKRSIDVLGHATTAEPSKIQAMEAASLNPAPANLTYGGPLPFMPLMHSNLQQQQLMAMMQLAMMMPPDMLASMMPAFPGMMPSMPAPIPLMQSPLPPLNPVLAGSHAFSAQSPAPRLILVTGPEHQVFKDAPIRLRVKLLNAVENGLNVPFRLQLQITLEDMHGHSVDSIVKGRRAGERILSSEFVHASINANFEIEVPTVRIREVSANHAASAFALVIRISTMPNVAAARSPLFYVRSERMRSPSYRVLGEKKTAMQSSQTSKVAPSQSQTATDSSQSQSQPLSQPQQQSQSQSQPLSQPLSQSQSQQQQSQSQSLSQQQQPSSQVSVSEPMPQQSEHVSLDQPESPVLVMVDGDDDNEELSPPETSESAAASDKKPDMMHEKVDWVNQKAKIALVLP